jgi:acetyltransferase
VKLDICKKPIFPVLPSVVNARKEIQHFLDKGNVNFPEEVLLGKALGAVYRTPKPTELKVQLPEVDAERIRTIVSSSEHGYVTPEVASDLLDAAGISVVKEVVSSSIDELLFKIENFTYPLVMKVVGPLHKSDVQGVLLNVRSKDEVRANFDKLMSIKDATGVMVQPMISGLELFVGVKKEPNFKHTILCGLGGVYIEVLKDVSAALSPVSKVEAQKMIASLRGYQLIQGARGQEGVNEAIFVEVVQRLSALVEVAPEIVEMDINPLLGTQKHITAVDVRVCIEK